VLERLLGLDEVGAVTYFELLLRSPWPRLVVLALILVAIAYAIFLYRRETSLPRRGRVVLGVCRAAVLGLLVLALFEPILGLEMTVKQRRTLLVLLDTSESMTTRDPRRTEDELKDAALALGSVPFANAAKPLPESARVDAAGASRIELAKGLLARPTANLFERLGENYTVRYFGFGERLEPTEGKGESAPEALRAAQAAAKVTRLGTALQEAVDRNTGQPIAGVIVLTDGISNDGLEPLAVAQRLGERSIPIYPIGLGLPQPPDVRLQHLIVPDTVFHKDRVPVRVEIVSSGYANRTANLSVSIDGQQVAAKAVNLTGAAQFEELQFIPRRSPAR
jgi:hypothetical protein